MATFWKQTYYLIYRNVLLKKNTKKQTYQEIFIPLVFMLSLTIISQTNKSQSFSPIPSSVLGTYPLYGPDRHFMPNKSIPLGFAPNNANTAAIMSETTLRLNITANPKVIGYDTEQDLLAAYVSQTVQFEIAIIFDSSFPGNLSYTIRLPYGSGPGTLNTRADPGACRSQVPLPGLDNYGCPANAYLYSGFAALQVAVEYSIASVVSGNSSLPFPSVWVQMFPKAQYTNNNNVLQTTGTLYYVIMFTPFIAILMTNLVSEKEKKIKECMKIMGMKDPAFWVAWGVTYFTLISVVSVAIVGLSFAIGVFRNSNVLLVYLYFVIYGLSIVTLSFMITPFFNKALAAGAAGSSLTVLMSLIYLPLNLVEGIPLFVQWLLSLLSPVAFALGIDKAISYETTHGGLTWESFTEGEFPPYACLVMLTVDALLYLLLAIYFENVIPSAYGLRKPPWFFLLPSFWCPRQTASSDKTHLLPEVGNEHDTVNENISPDDIEAFPADVRSRDGIRIRGLMKTFPGNKRKGKPDVHAINGISLDIYEGHIICLLGHNGAGKSTLINALTGLLSADSGSATIYGLNIRNPNEMDRIRTMTGVCSQENTLFDYLSPAEHLKVYAGLKGVPSEEIDDQVHKLLKEVELDKQSAVHSKDLSGGQKRKLCVAMALIGNPKVLFLDEPSSGMDPYSRRQLWSLLKKQREGRVTLLTTHFMDEADILADRKAIISKGALRCYGSSLFLKNRFGIGYHLGMVVEQNCSVDPITTLVQSKVPEAKVGRSHGMELSYILPLKDISTFAGLFEALEEKHESGDVTVATALGVQSYGVSMTTLEEVFLKLGEEAEEDDRGTEPKVKDRRNGNQIDVNYCHNEEMQVEGNNHQTQHATTVELKQSALDSTVLATKPVASSYWAQVKAMTWIQVLQAVRNPSTYIMRIIFPCVYFVVGVFMVKWTNFGHSEQIEPTLLALETSLYLAGVDDIVTSQKTALLYKDSLPTGQNIDELVAQFNGSLEMASQSQSNLSALLSVAPHSVAIDVEDIAENARYTALYNDTAIHALPISINIMSNALYSMLQGLTTDQKINALYQPMPKLDLSYSFNSGFFMVLFLGIAMVGIPVGFAVNVVRDRQIKARAQLRVSGVEMSAYWGSRCIVDFLQYAFVALICIIILVAFQPPSLTQPGALFLLVIFLLLYIPLSTLHVYCVSFGFNDFETVQGVLPSIYIWASFIVLAPVYVLDLLGSSEIAFALHLAFCILVPPYSFFGTVYYIDKVYQYAVIYGTVDQLTFGSYFKMENYIVPSLLVVCIPLVGLYFLLRYLEIRNTGGDPRDTCPIRTGKRPLKASKVNTDIVEEEDTDVTSERRRVQQIFEQNKNSAVAIHSLRCEFVKRTGGGACNRETKEEKTKVAVRNLSLAVNHGEVMGLLGPNGAGKTTALNVVIAEHEPTKGQVRVAGHDITSSVAEAFQSMGFCPQVDPLWQEITMREHLVAYGLIKGIQKCDITHITEHYMECLGILEHADKRPKALSGGTKRKLCFALSMLGNSQIVLLDEPSTGMDPKSKRFLWNTITSSFADKRGAILTTHSMEEADAVCSKVGIMVAGQLVCLGTTQHLKDKYGGGYVLEIKLKMGALHHDASSNTQDLLEDKVEALQKFVQEILPNAEVMENFQERISYKIPKRCVSSLSSVFAAMEKGKETLGIEEFSFTQSTLEQVFIEFAKLQDEEEGELSNEGNNTSRHLHRQVSVQIGNASSPDADINL